MEFTVAASALSPVDFARDVVSKSLGAVHVVVGEDFRFGARRSGDASELVRVGRALGLEVEVRPKVVWRGGAVSSSRIREAVARGEVELARALCGRPFDVEGTVVRGDGRGRQIGIPTANLATGASAAIPGSGVYAAWAIIQSGARHPAVVNTGTRPTFGGTIPRLEAHLLGFSGSLYGQSLLLQFVAHIREERRFGSAKDLVAQIGRDILESQRLLELPPPFLG
jgi:riboflavin kinase/FMN adenylyltransferase